MLARKLILGFGFAVLLPMLIHYGIDVFVPGPETREYHRQLRDVSEREKDTSGEEKAKLRAQRQQLERAHETQEDRSQQIHFFVGAPLGIVVTLIGSFIRVQAIGGGLMLGGIFTFTEGCFWYWTDLSRAGRFVILLVAFGVLLWIGYQRLSELKQPRQTK